MTSIKNYLKKLREDKFKTTPYNTNFSPKVQEHNSFLKYFTCQDQTSNDCTWYKIRRDLPFGLRVILAVLAYEISTGSTIPEASCLFAQIYKLEQVFLSR